MQTSMLSTKRDDFMYSFLNLDTFSFSGTAHDTLYNLEQSSASRHTCLVKRDTFQVSPVLVAVFLPMGQCGNFPREGTQPRRLSGA